MKTRFLQRLLFFIALLVLFIIVLRNFRLKNEEKPALPPESSFTFAVISDIHSDINSLQATVDKARTDGVQFIIATGDLTMLGKIEELKKVKTALDKTSIPYYVIPGNHDLWSVKGGSKPYREVFGADYMSFSKDGVKFILINNGDGVVGIDEKQSRWLREELASCPKIYCLVFAHMPLNHSFLAHIMGEDSTKVASQAANLVKELVDNKVQELFAGHIHFLSSYELDGLLTNTVGAVYTDKGTVDSRFLEVKVNIPDITLSKKEIWLTVTPGS